MEISERDKTTAHVALLAITLAAILRTAWISDASINTLRSAVNFVHGAGPVVHVNDRVQSFIHPLWFLLIAAGTLVTRNAFAATFILSIVLSFATVWILIGRVASSFWAGMLAGTILLLSKAYLDYSSSGLETPLAHFLLILGVMLGLESFDSDSDCIAPGSIIALASIYLCRPSLLLAVLPFGILVLWRSYKTPRQTAIVVALAIVPALCWTIFSRLYYREAIPAQVFAHLQGNPPRIEDVRQGIVYLLDSLSVDPLTLTIVSLAILLSLQRSVELKALAAGSILYLIYVVSVGGDSMSGHLMTIPLLASAVIVSRSDLSAVGNAGIAAMIAVLGAISAPTTIFAGPKYAAGEVVHGIRDERGASYVHQGLANSIRSTFMQPEEWTPR
jgi:arabinofuranosyltransferase